MSNPVQLPNLFEDLQGQVYRFQDIVDQPQTSDSPNFAVVHDLHDKGDLMSLVYLFSEQSVLPLDEDEDFFTKVATASQNELRDLLSDETIALAQSDFRSVDPDDPNWTEKLTQNWTSTTD